MRIIDGKRNGRGKKGKQNQDEMKNRDKTEIEEGKAGEKLKKENQKI